METMTAFLALSIGLLVQLAFPIVVTWVMIYFLRKLDARWQAEAELRPVSVQKPECWKIKGCSLEQQKTCVARTSPRYPLQKSPPQKFNVHCLHLSLS